MSDTTWHKSCSIKHLCIEPWFSAILSIQFISAKSLIYNSGQTYLINLIFWNKHKHKHNSPYKHWQAQTIKKKINACLPLCLNHNWKPVISNIWVSGDRTYQALHGIRTDCLDSDSDIHHLRGQQFAMSCPFNSC